MIEALGWLRGGYFLDSGASDGVGGSNSYVLETQFDWSGICIEPNDRMFLQLQANRRCICINCCLWHRAGPVEFFEAAGVYGGIVEAYDGRIQQFAEEQAKAASTQRELPTPVCKQAREIREILKTCKAPETIDYWSLDTEGSELAILKSFPFDQHEIRVLTVEHNYTAMRGHINEFLASKNMTRIAELGIDDVYMSRHVGRSSAWRSQVWTRPGSPRRSRRRF